MISILIQTWHEEETNWIAGLIHPMNSPSSKKHCAKGLFLIPQRIGSSVVSTESPQNIVGMIGWSLRIFWVSWARNIWTRPMGPMGWWLAHSKNHGECWRIWRIGCFWRLWEMGHIWGYHGGSGGCAHRISGFWCSILTHFPVTHEGQLWSWLAWTGAMSFSTKWYNWWLFRMDNNII